MKSKVAERMLAKTPQEITDGVEKYAESIVKNKGILITEVVQGKIDILDLLYAITNIDDDSDSELSRTIERLKNGLKEDLTHSVSISYICTEHYEQGLNEGSATYCFSKDDMKKAFDAGVIGDYDTNFNQWYDDYINNNGNS